jgi:hypothetical protein
VVDRRRFGDCSRLSCAQSFERSSSKSGRLASLSFVYSQNLSVNCGFEMGGCSDGVRDASGPVRAGRRTLLVCGSVRWISEARLQKARGESRPENMHGIQQPEGCCSLPFAGYGLGEASAHAGTEAAQIAMSISARMNGLPANPVRRRSGVEEAAEKLVE